MSRNIIITACILARKLKFSGNKNMEKGSILTSKISLPYHSNLPPEVKCDKTASLAIKEKKTNPSLQLGKMPLMSQNTDGRVQWSQFGSVMFLKGKN